MCGSVRHCRISVCAACSVVLGLSLAGFVVAQTPAVGEQFQVNTAIAGAQSDPDVGVAGTGDFIIVWSNAGQNVAFRRFDAGGNPLSGETTAHSGTAPFMVADPTVSADADGDFVVAWSEYYNGMFRIGAGVFGADGAGQTGDFLVNTGSAGYGYDPEVASDPDGNFVVVWEHYGDVSAKVFDAAGSATSSAFQVNTTTAGMQTLPDVGMDGDGDIVVSWLDAGGAVKFRRFDQTGAALGGETQVSSGMVGAPRLDMADNGEFVVAWREYASDTDIGFFIFGQQFSASGSAASAKTRVSATGEGEGVPSVSLENGGDFVVVWQTPSGAAGGEIDRREFDSAFGPLSSDDQINTFTTSTQERPVVQGNGNGVYAVAWMSEGSSGTDNDSSSVQARVFGTLEIFSDDFESSTTTNWSSAVGEN